MVTKKSQIEPKASSLELAHDVAHDVAHDAAHDVAHEPQKKMSTLQKVKLANQIIEAVESKSIRSAFMTLTQGDAIHKIFVDAAEKHVESLMGNDSLEEDLSAAQQKVDEIVMSCVKLQQALVQSVKQVVNGGGQTHNQPSQQRNTVQKPLPQHKGIKRQRPIYEEDEEMFQDENNGLLY